MTGRRCLCAQPAVRFKNGTFVCQRCDDIENGVTFRAIRDVGRNRIMAQTKRGAEKLAAAKWNVTFDEYRWLRNSRIKPCTVCRGWKLESAFNRDNSRYDGLSPKCRECQNGLGRSRHKPIPLEARKPYGPTPQPGRDGDKLQARARVNREVKAGRLPKPNDVPCKICGHIGTDRRHEYHHAKGYSAAHHLTVESHCTKCHRVVEPVWKSRSRNRNGQFYGPAN